MPPPQASPHQVPGGPRIPPFWSRWRFGWLEAGFLGLVGLALGLRLWELDGRAMHYDEAIHVHFAWRLANSEGGLWGWPWIFGRDYIHSPWMHGPFQIEFTALVFRIFGDSDFTARLGYVLFGAALVALPYFLRDYLGRGGAFLASVMLLFSPALLYFARFGREDILMAFWVTALLVLMWRYVHEGNHRYLYLASAVLAFMFATKETAYFVVLIFGAILFLLALPELVPWALGRIRLPDLVGPAGFLLLLVTLTLPQWSAASGLVQDTLGLTLVNPDPQTGRHVPNINGSPGLVGAPAWATPLLKLPFNVDPLVNDLLPRGVPRMDTGANGLPINYLVAGGVLAAAFLLSCYLGVAWLGGVWLACAAIFYFIWLTLYTTFYTNWAGAFSGIWQGMGYWIAQQDVARGNQPWYYYFVGLSVYELLPVLFGLLAAAYFARRGDIFGLVLTTWAGLTFLAYTVASEKMPWLLVHVTLPFILLTGKFLGELAEQVPWRRAAMQGHLVLPLLPALATLAGVYLLYRYTGRQSSFSPWEWGLMAGAALLIVEAAFLMRRVRPRAGMALVGLGVAALLLAFGAWTAFRAAYIYDDSSKEMLVYAQAWA